MTKYADAIEFALLTCGLFLLITGTYNLSGDNRHWILRTTLSLTGTSVRLAGLTLMIPGVIFLGGKLLNTEKAYITAPRMIMTPINTLLAFYAKLVPFQSYVIGGTVILAILLVMSGKLTDFEGHDL